MIYSVPRPQYGYDYYEGPDVKLPETGGYRAPRGQPINGVFAPQQFLAILPSGTVKTGSGTVAQGILARPPQGLLEGIPAPVKDLGRGLLWTGVGWFLRNLFR